MLKNKCRTGDIAKLVACMNPWVQSLALHTLCVWWSTPVAPALGREWQKDVKFIAILH